MVELENYNFKPLNTKNKITPEEYFMDAYIDERFESESLSTATKIMHTILDNKYKNMYFKHFMKKQCQNPTEKELNY